MNRRMADSSSIRTSTCICASLSFLGLCYSVNSWLIVPSLSPSYGSRTSTMGSSYLPSSPPSYACPPQKVGIACARRSTRTTLARYAVFEDGNGQDMSPRSGEPFTGGWWWSLWAETTSWLDYFAFLRVNYEMDLGGATVTAVEDGNVPANVPRSDGPLTTTRDDVQDERLSFSANATLAAYNDGRSGTSNAKHFSAGGNASDIQPSALLKKESNVLETSKKETAVDDGPSQAEATEIMASRGESDAVSAERAYRLLDAERGAKCVSCGDGGEALSLLTKATAAALLSWIRCKTDGNGLVITDDGGVATSDTAERQKLWAAHAPTVLKLLAEVGKEPSSDPELQQLYTEAMMYSTSSQGILEAFVTGKALSFTSAMSVLVKKFPEQDNGVAYVFQGSYFLAAPWPIRSPTKARESFEKAVKVNGRSRRNLYYAGVGRLACGDRYAATEMFRRAASDEDSESASAIERDIATVLREQSQRGLAICERGTVA